MEYKERENKLMNAKCIFIEPNSGMIADIIYIINAKDAWSIFKNNPYVTELMHTTLF